MVKIANATVGCRHCQRTMLRLVNRGLCCRCYNDPAIREQYPRLVPGPRAIRPCTRCHDVRPSPRHGGVCLRCRTTPTAEMCRNSTAEPTLEPTTAVPGTAAKVAVLAERLRRGVPLNHPQDAILDDSDNTRSKLPS